MASQPQIDDEDDFGGDYAGSHRSDKRTFEDLDGEEDDVFGSKKKAKSKVEESGPGAATGMILSLRESLQSCKDSLATCQKELEDAQSEIRKWHSAFQNGPATPGTSPEPELMLTFLQNLKSSEESLKEKLEKAKKREAAFIVAYAKREQESADLKSAVRELKKQLRPPSVQTRRLLLDPAIHEQFRRLKNLVEERDKKIRELQDNVAAVNFNANSRMGKKLMAKCRTLQEENEEIGAMASEGKIHELVMKIAVLKSQNTELRDQFDALYKYMAELSNDMERSNEMVFVLQDQLEAKDYELERLKDELRRTQEMVVKNESEPEAAAVESNDEKKADEEIISPELETET